jgi:outer membrane lipoprotein carrier protein
MLLPALVAVLFTAQPAVAAKAKPAVAAKSEAADAGVATVKSVVAVPVMTPEVKALVDRVQAFYEKTDDFTASFKQEYTYKAFKRVQSSTGKVTFKKPALMRWEYEKPSPKTFVLAGDKVYAHDPEAMTLTKASIGTNQLSASVTFLWGKGRLADEFAIARAACDKCAGTLLEMVPLKPDPRFQRIRLEVDPKSAMVVKSTVVDPDGSENAITFLELKTNTGIGADFFKLNPPAGTQVQDFTKMAAPGPEAPMPKPAAAVDGGSAANATPAGTKDGGAAKAAAVGPAGAKDGGAAKAAPVPPAGPKK